MTTLGDLMVVRGGSVNPAASPDEEFELYSIPAHDRGGPEIAKGSAIGSSKQIVEPSDVMISKIIPHIRRARVVGPSSGRRQIASGEWIVFRGESFHPAYLRHFLLSNRFHAQFMNTVAGVGGSLVRARPQQVKSIDIPMPSNAEQRRIAAILDHADALRAKRREVLVHFDALTQSIFHDMFAGTETSAMLGDVSEIQGGLQVSHRRASLPVEVPYLRVANAHRGRLDLTEIKLIRVTAAEAQRTKLMSGDLLFVEGHANPLEVGRLALWAGEVENCVHQNHLIRARLDQSQVLPAFAAVWFNTPLGAAHFRRAGRTTSGLNTINSSTVRSAPLSVPAMKKQQEFAARIKQSTAVVELVKRGLAADDELFASLQSRAFKGEL